MSKFETALARKPLVPLLELEKFGPNFRGMSEKTAKRVGRYGRSQ